MVSREEVNFLRRCERLTRRNYRLLFNAVEKKVFDDWNKQMSLKFIMVKYNFPTTKDTKNYLKRLNHRVIWLRQQANKRHRQKEKKRKKRSNPWLTVRKRIARKRELFITHPDGTITCRDVFYTVTRDKKVLKKGIAVEGMSQGLIIKNN